MHRDNARGAKDSFVQPSHAEQDDQGADDQLQGRLGDPRHDQLAEDHDEHSKRDQCNESAV